jgi:hypothetical protein
MPSALRQQYPQEVAMKVNIFAAVALIVFASEGSAFAQTKADRCAAYARNAAQSTPTTTGAARGAARGTVGAAIAGGDAGRGAAAGAIVGGTRRAAQRSRSYQSYYDECMRR